MGQSRQQDLTSTSKRASLPNQVKTSKAFVICFRHMSQLVEIYRAPTRRTLGVRLIQNIRFFLRLASFKYSGDQGRRRRH